MPEIIGSYTQLRNVPEVVGGVSFSQIFMNLWEMVEMYRERKVLAYFLSESNTSP
jgi:hypothetical protein